MTTLKDYLSLIEIVRHHDICYYVKHQPEISDEEYDYLLYRLIKIEQEHPEWIIENSPTKKIGERLTSGFKSVAHNFPMLSLANTYSYNEIHEWIKRIEKSVPHPAFVTELKMDGIAISVIYEKGRFMRAITRGDGYLGDDVTSNVRTIHTLPLILNEKIDYLEIRGEVFMPHASFYALNKERLEEGLESWANPRNAAAGSLKLLDPKESSKRNLQITFYGLMDPLRYHIETQWDALRFMKKLGLPVNKEVALCHNFEEITQFADKIAEKRSSLDFDIDGIVVKLNSLHDSEEMGYTGKTARFAFAYKFTAERAETRLLDITLQVGKSGVITPVAELDPVFLAGSTISRATLHNFDEIKSKDIRLNDTVVIQKAGDVIPQILGVVREKRPQHSTPWQAPTTCPCCHTPLIHKENLIATFCPNRHCHEQNMRRLIFFCSKSGLDIEHLGEQMVRLLVEKQLVNTFADFFHLQFDDLAALEGLGEKSAHNILAAINEKRTPPLARLLVALGMRHVGTTTSELLAHHFVSLDALMRTDEASLEKIDGIGPKTAHEIVSFFKDPSHQQEIQLLLHAGVTIATPKAKIASPGSFFANKHFVCTGTLSHWTRQEAFDAIVERGGIISETLSRKTDYLIAGDKAGSKLEKARKLGVQVLTEEDFNTELKKESV